MRHFDFLMTVWSSDILSELTFLKKEINQKFFESKMFLYWKIAECLNKKNEFSIFNWKDFLWLDFLKLLSDLIMKMTNSIKINQNSETAKQIRKSWTQKVQKKQLIKYKISLLFQMQFVQILFEMCVC